MATSTLDNVIPLLKPDTQQKLISCAKRAKLSPDALLNTLIDDETERQRLFSCGDESTKEKETAPSQKITRICKQHLSALQFDSEGVEFRTAIETLYIDLLQKNIISVKSRKDNIVESKRLKVGRTDYYWYAGSLAERTAMWFGTLNVYLYHKFMHPSEIIFVGMPANVEVCYQIYLHLYKLLKNTRIAHKKNAGNWGTKSEIEEDANYYMSNFIREFTHIDAYIENDDYNKHVYAYAREHFAYAMRD